jgi:DNA-binding response OmpR family regulator
MTKILVVDDEPDVVVIISRMLKGLGYDVITASDGEVALEKLKGEKPDLVTLDIMMPGMNGYEVLKSIRKDPETSHIPVLMVSVKDDKEDIVKGLEIGANDYMTKPYQKTILLAKVRSLLKLKKMDDRIRDHSTTLEDEAEEREQVLAEVHEALKESHEKLKVQYAIQEKDLNLATLQIELDKIKLNFTAAMTGISSITLLLALVIALSTEDVMYLIGLLLAGISLFMALVWIAQRKMDAASSRITKIKHEEVKT